MTHPRIQNGWVDSKQPARGGQKRCPNCHSENFRETLSREICHSCGLECDYWGGGANQVYRDMAARREKQILEIAKQRRIAQNIREFGYDLEDEE